MNQTQVMHVLVRLRCCRSTTAHAAWSVLVRVEFRSGGAGLAGAAEHANGGAGADGFVVGAQVRRDVDQFPLASPRSEGLLFLVFANPFALSKRPATRTPAAVVVLAA